MEKQAQQWVDELESSLRQKADTARAAASEAYLRHQFVFWGVSAPDRREIIANLRPAFKKIDPPVASEFVKLCWQLPAREMQHAGMELFVSFATHQQADVINTCGQLISHKSWWDTVDYIAPNIAGKWFQKHPEDISSVTGRWMKSGNLWLQRSCLLFQLKYKDQLDFGLLQSFILQLNTHPDFFIRKAIGWSLRNYARQNPEGVKAFVEKTAMASLSQREAMKHLE